MSADPPAGPGTGAPGAANATAATGAANATAATGTADATAATGTADATAATGAANATAATGAANATAATGTADATAATDAPRASATGAGATAATGAGTTGATGAGATGAGATGAGATAATGAGATGATGAGATGAGATGAPPLLAAVHARIAVDDVVAIEDLSLVTRGDRVLLVGEAGVLFGALSGVPLLAAASPDSASPEAGVVGEVRIVGGEVRLHGHDVAAQAHLPTSGFAPLDPPVPGTMTAHAYVTWAARLAGIPPRAARDLAESALRRVGLERVASRPAAALGLPERRVLQIAKAIVHQPAVLVAEAPLDRLEGAAAAFVAGALGAATDGRRALLSARRVDPATPEGAIARTASHLVFLGEGGVVTEGSPEALSGSARVYRLTVTTNAPALRAALAARGLALESGPVHFTVVLPPGSTTTPLLEAASEARAAVIEMVPLLPG